MPKFLEDDLAPTAFEEDENLALRLMAPPSKTVVGDEARVTCSTMVSMHPEFLCPWELETSTNSLVKATKIPALEAS